MNGSDKKYTFRSEHFNQNAFLIELLNKLDKTEDKKNLLSLIDNNQQRILELSIESRKLYELIIQLAHEYCIKETEAYQEIHKNRMNKSFRPDRVKHNINERAIENMGKYLSTLISFVNSSNQEFSESMLRSTQSLYCALAKLLDQNSEILDQLRLLTNQKDMGGIIE